MQHALFSARLCEQCTAIGNLLSNSLISSGFSELSVLSYLLPMTASIILWWFMFKWGCRYLCSWWYYIGCWKSLLWCLHLPDQRWRCQSAQSSNKQIPQIEGWSSQQKESNTYHKLFWTTEACCLNTWTISACSIRPIPKLIRHLDWHSNAWVHWPWMLIKGTHDLLVYISADLTLTYLHYTCLPIGIKDGEWFCNTICHMNNSFCGKKCHV